MRKFGNFDNLALSNPPKLNPLSPVFISTLVDGVAPPPPCGLYSWEETLPHTSPCIEFVDTLNGSVTGGFCGTMIIIGAESKQIRPEVPTSLVESHMFCCITCLIWYHQDMTIYRRTFDSFGRMWLFSVHEKKNSIRGDIHATLQ